MYFKMRNIKYYDISNTTRVGGQCNFLNTVHSESVERCLGVKVVENETNTT